MSTSIDPNDGWRSAEQDIDFWQEWRGRNEAGQWRNGLAIGRQKSPRTGSI